VLCNHSHAPHLPLSVFKLPLVIPPVPDCLLFKDFSNELIRVFDPILPEREAARGLLSIKQGSRRVTEYIIHFHTLATDSKWNIDALFDAFYQGLFEEIKDEIGTHDPPKTLLKSWSPW